MIRHSLETHPQEECTDALTGRTAQTFLQTTTPAPGICYVFSRLYPMTQITNIQPFSFARGDTPIHSSSAVPRTQPACSLLRPISTHTHRSQGTARSQASPSTPSVSSRRRNQPPGSKNTRAFPSTYHLVLHTKGSHIKCNHTRQLQNLAATCHLPACQLYMGLPLRACLLHHTQKPASSRLAPEHLPTTPQFTGLHVLLSLNARGFALHPHGKNVPLNLPQHKKQAYRFLQLSPACRNDSFPLTSYKLQ